MDFPKVFIKSLRSVLRNGHPDLQFFRRILEFYYEMAFRRGVYLFDVTRRRELEPDGLVEGPFARNALAFYGAAILYFQIAAVIGLPKE